jgi:glutamate synthase domain-containing protein 3
MRTGRDVVIGALLGAERFGFGTAALVSLGCILMRKCHLGMCPTGIATQDPDLRKRFAGKAEYLVRYLTFVAEDIRGIMARLGFRKFDDMVGRVDRLGCRKAVDHWKALGLDFSAVLLPPERSNGCALRRVRPQTDRHQDHLDWEILRRLGWEKGDSPHLPERPEGCFAQMGTVPFFPTPAQLDMPIRNIHRAVGAVLSNRIARQHGGAGLPDGTIQITLTGSAGQSFGAFLARGVTLRLVGDANDYLGKGLSGGRIIVQTPPGSPFDPKENVIVGNTLLYGATSGELFVNGLAGERFAVRNSGAVAVVEGLGDHGCEYMTAGTVVVLGRTGRNFAAGMSGGVAYVFDDRQLFDTLCNLDMVDLEPVHLAEDLAVLEDLIRRHLRWTGSFQAKLLLDRWRETAGRFVKVMPIDYRKALERLREREQVQGDAEPATEEVYR